MGYDDDEFEYPDRVSQVLKCQICMDVLETPQIIIHCEHIFCKHCIDDWLDRKLKCPVCRIDINISRHYDVKPAPLMIRQLLNDLSMKCVNCSAVMPMEQMVSHKKSCKEDDFKSSGLDREKEKLKNQVLCLEGQLQAKDQEIKNLVEQRNTLRDKNDNLEQNSNTDNKNKEQTTTKSPLTENQKEYSSNSSSTQKCPTCADRAIEQSSSPSLTKIEYIEDPRIADKCDFLERQLNTVKNKHQREIDSLRDEMRNQKLSDSRKIEQLECQIDENEATAFENLRSIPRNQNNSAVCDFSPSEMFGQNTTVNTEPDQNSNATANTDNNTSATPSTDEQVLQLQILLTTYQDEKEHYAKKLKETKKELAESQRCRGDNQDTLNRANSNVKKYEEQRDELFQDMLSLQKEKSGLKAENHTLMRKCSQEKEESSKLKVEWKKELQTVKWLNDDMELQVDNLKMDITRLKGKINRLELENEGLRAQITRLNRDDRD